MKKAYLLLLFCLSFSLIVHAQNVFSENFNNVPNLLSGGGWTQLNKSYPLGYDIWHNGTHITIGPYDGFGNQYAEVGTHSVNDTAAGTISNWLITPAIMLDNGYKVSFYTTSLQNQQNADRLELRLNSANTTNVGTSENSTGDFTTLLLTVNPNLTTGAADYPEGQWGQYSATVTGLSGQTQCRIALRYFVTNGGLLGTHGSYIGIDAFSVDGPNGVEDISSAKPFITVYPNPAFEQLTVDFARPLAEDGTASVYNTVGKLVYSFPMAKGQLKSSVAIKELAGGIYTVSVKTYSSIFNAYFIKE